MKKTILSMSFALVLTGSVSAIAATGIPSNAQTSLELDCIAQLDGVYSKVTKVVIRDVTYKTPPSTWNNHNSLIDLYSSNGILLEGILNESNGNDPQDYRDTDPSQNGNTGGIALYVNAGAKLVLITKSEVNQVNLAKRNYIFSVNQVAENDELIVVSKGQLQCTVK